MGAATPEQAGAGVAGGSAAGARQVLAAARGRAPEAAAAPPPAAHKPALGSLKKRPPDAPPGGLRPPDPRAAAQAPATEEAAAPSGTSVPGLEQLTAAWADHVLPRLSSVSKGRFSTGRFTGVSDGAAVLALPNPIMRDKCEEKRPELERVLAEHFRAPVPVRLVVDPAVGAEAATSGAVLRAAPEHEEPVDLDDLVDAPADGRTGIDRLTQAFPGAEVLGG